MGSQKHTVHVMQTELTKVVKEDVERYGLSKISATAVVPVSETNASRGTSGSSGSKSDGSVDIVVRVALLDSRLADFSIPVRSRVYNHVRLLSMHVRLQQPPLGKLSVEI